MAQYRNGGGFSEWYNKSNEERPKEECANDNPGQGFTNEQVIGNFHQPLCSKNIRDKQNGQDYCGRDMVLLDDSFPSLTES